MSSEPSELLRLAIGRRRELLARLHAESTDCYRLLHGITEGAPGLTLDRYGTLLLAQTFRERLPAASITDLQTVVRTELGLELPIVCNHRGHGDDEPLPADIPLDHVCHEAGVAFAIRARHRGQDPWLFLDLRAGRRAVRELAAQRSVLNLFAYTCGVGVVAAVAGASSVLNVDFAASALAVGRDNATRNRIEPARFEVLHADCIPVLRQFAGLPVQRRSRHTPYPRLAVRHFDLVVLDPPRFAKTPFGTIDVVRDYQSLFKPCLLSLQEGGAVLATNHVPSVGTEAWHEVLRRCAAKAARPLRSLEAIEVDGDFPSFDGQPPLKMVLART